MASPAEITATSRDRDETTIAELEESNPELLQMAHNFAAGLKNYLHVIQGFALLYRSLLVQSQAERGSLH